VRQRISLTLGYAIWQSFRIRNRLRLGGERDYWHNDRRTATVTAVLAAETDAPAPRLWVLTEMDSDE
jgi:hypothetical protein